MAITTLDGALAGFKPPHTFAKTPTGTLVAGRPVSLFYLTGMPGAATAPAPGMGGEALTSYAGQIPFSNPAGSELTYLARLQAMATIGGVLVLADRLWHNSGISVTTTTAQTINSVAWPARDINGSTEGVGVYIGLEVRTATGAGAATPSISYTNSANAGSKTGSMLVTYSASSAAGTFHPFTLDAGDVGVRSIQSVTLGVSMTSGAVHLVAYREIARLEFAAAQTSNAIDLVTGGFPQLFNNSVPFLFFIPNNTTSTAVSGQLIYSQG